MIYKPIVWLLLDPRDLRTSASNNQQESSSLHYFNTIVYLIVHQYYQLWGVVFIPVQNGPAPAADTI